MANLQGSWKKYVDYKYYSGEDAIKPFTVKIKSTAIKPVFDKKQMRLIDKPVLYFYNTDKGVVLIQTNAKIIEANLGTEKMQDWINKEITLFGEPSKQHGHVLRVRKIIKSNTKL